MRDSVEIQIGGNSISKFLSYEADSNILTPADAFQCTLGGLTDNEMKAIKTGEKFTLLVRSVVEMRGIIDKKAITYDSSKREVSLEGRDYMGLLVDSSVEEFATLNEIKLKDLAAWRLKDVPFIDKSDINYSLEKAQGYSVKKKKAHEEKFDDLIKQSQPDIGQSIFEVLSDYAQRKGLIFWCNPDGQLVFGEPKKDGPAEFWFYTYTINVFANKHNNIISAKLTDDISKRYSKITVSGQVQGSDVLAPGEHTTVKTASDDSFPYHKPLVLQASVESEKAAESQVQWEIKKRVVEGWQVELTVAGHRQGNSGNYRANSICYIKDEVLMLDGNYLILGRKFTMDRSEGPKTILTIGKLMEGYTVG